MPGFDAANPDGPVRRGPEPQLPEPARAGVVPGDRPDQLPAQLLAPGAGAGLRPAAGRDQHRPGQHQHQPGLRLRPRLRQDHRLRVRHPARVQRRHGAGHRRLQQGHRERPGGASGQPVRSGAGPRQRLPDADQSGLRQRPGHRHPAGPAVRQLLQRHRRLRLPAGQEHRLRSVHLRQLRLADREPGGRQQRGAAAAAGHPADRRQPPARADRRLLRHAARRLSAGQRRPAPSSATSACS